MLKRFKELIRNLNLNIVLFVLPLCILGLINTFKHNSLQVSQIENRTLKTRPVFSLAALASGRFIKDFEDYYSDTFLYRERLVKLSSEISKLKGIAMNKKVSIVSVKREKEILDAKKIPSSGNEASKVISNNVADSANDNIGVSGETSNNEVVNNYIINENSAVEIHNYNESLYTQYAQAINKLKASLEEGVNVYDMLLPSSFEFIKDKKYKNLGEPEILGMNKVNTVLESGVKRVNAYDALSRNSDKYIFFRTDPHWTALGAYYAYTAFMKVKEETPIPLSKYTENKLDGYVGTIYGATLNKKLKDNPDTVYYYKPYLESKFYSFSGTRKISREILDFNTAKSFDKYCLFLGGLRARGEITTDIHNKKSILVIKDSFGNAFVPFLIPHYEKIYILDPRAIDINVRSFIKEKGIQEVLVMNNVFAVTKYDFPNLIEKLSM